MPQKDPEHYYGWTPHRPRPDKNTLRMRRGPGHNDINDDADAVRTSAMTGRLESVYPTNLPGSNLISLPLPERQAFGRRARLAS